MPWNKTGGMTPWMASTASARVLKSGESGTTLHGCITLLARHLNVPELVKYMVHTDIHMHKQIIYIRSSFDVNCCTALRVSPTEFLASTW